MHVTRLIYYSENQVDPTEGSRLRALGEILHASNRNNRALGLTGALVCDEQWFLQVLEGERAQVWRAFERIREDERHSGLVVAEVADATTRIFSNWWMGLAVRTAKTEAVFARFAPAGRFDPRAMRAAEMRAMMVALAGLGLSRELATDHAVPLRHDAGLLSPRHA